MKSQNLDHYINEYKKLMNHRNTRNMTKLTSYFEQRYKSRCNCPTKRKSSGENIKNCNCVM